MRAFEQKSDMNRCIFWAKHAGGHIVGWTAARSDCFRRPVADTASRFYIRGDESSGDSKGVMARGK